MHLCKDLHVHALARARYEGRFVHKRLAATGGLAAKWLLRFTAQKGLSIIAPV